MPDATAVMTTSNFNQKRIELARFFEARGTAPHAYEKPPRIIESIPANVTNASTALHVASRVRAGQGAGQDGRVTSPALDAALAHAGLAALVEDSDTSALVAQLHALMAGTQARAPASPAVLQGLALESIQRRGFSTGAAADLIPQLITRSDLRPANRALRIVDCTTDCITYFANNEVLHSSRHCSEDTLPAPSINDITLMRVERRDGAGNPVPHYVLVDGTGEADNVVTDVPADGDCFFSCISHALGSQGPVERQSKNMELRRSLARYLVAQPMALANAVVADRPPIPRTIDNAGAMPRPAPQRTGSVQGGAPGGVRIALQANVTKRINEVFSNVKQEEQSTNVAAARAVSCAALPPLSSRGQPARVIHSQHNATDCLIELARSTDPSATLAIINPADRFHRGGGLGVRNFQHTVVPLEETLCMLGKGLKRSLDLAPAGPIGITTDDQTLLHSTDIRLRPPAEVLDTLVGVTVMGRDRMAAQQGILLKGALPAAPVPTGKPFDVFSIAALDRRMTRDVDYTDIQMRMERQFAHALVKARKRGISTVIMPVPGSGLFAKESRQREARTDQRYLGALAVALSNAVRKFGDDLTIVLPSHGVEMDALLRRELPAS